MLRSIQYTLTETDPRVITGAGCHAYSKNSGFKKLCRNTATTFVPVPPGSPPNSAIKGWLCTKHDVKGKLPEYTLYNPMKGVTSPAPAPDFAEFVKQKVVAFRIAQPRVLFNTTLPAQGSSSSSGEQFANTV